MSNTYTIQGQLLEMDTQAERLRIRFQRELSEKFSSHTKKLIDIEKTQNTILKKELTRLRRFLEDQPDCNCRPVICRTCGKILKNRHTYNQHQRTLHQMSRMSFEGRTTTDLEYQYPNYQENGNGNSWGPSPHLHNYTPVVNTSVSE